MVKGSGHAWIVVPYYGSTERKLKVSWEIGAKVEGAKPPPRETSKVAATWVIQLKLTEEEKDKWKIGDPIPIGDLWGITVLGQDGTPPPIYPQVSAKSILQEVTVRVERDKVCGPISKGSVTIIKEGVLPGVGYFDSKTKQFIQVSPPYDPPAPNEIWLDQNGVGRGLFPKGFRYVFNAPTIMSPPENPAIYEVTPNNVDVPPTTEVVFDAKLTNVVILKVYVYTSQPGFLTTANVWLFKRKPDGSFPESPDITAGTQRVREGGQEYEVATIRNVQLDKQVDETYRAVYKVRVFVAKDIPHEPYEDLWTLYPTCEERRSVTIQIKMGQGPGGGQ
ncbi:MAG: hypothetical protein NZ805_15535 [Armatimonadetes bacterium]|nr:hypothetical protein [Armatimonadota bacterium]MDW8029888.1 hypothetical protein [Armatimonadota bacterium]